MQINTKVTNKIIMTLAVLIIVATVVSFFFLNEAQRIVVLIGAALGIINLLGLGHFFNKNAGRRIR